MTRSPTSLTPHRDRDRDQAAETLAGGGGGQRPKQSLSEPKIGLEFAVSLINFIFWPEEHFSDVGGGWGGRPGLPRAPNTPRSLSNSLTVT